MGAVHTANVTHTAVNRKDSVRGLNILENMKILLIFEKKLEMIGRVPRKEASSLIESQVVTLERFGS